jgi:SNF2 family DNA or RNA helicase
VRTFGKVTLQKSLRLWAVEAEPHVVIRLKRVFLKIDKTEHGAVHLSDTPENCRELLWFLQRFPMVVRPRAYLEERARAYDERSERLVSVIEGKYEPRPFELALPPREYQKIAAETTLQAGSLLLADDVGLGKTASAIAVIAQPIARPALVVTLTHLPQQWAAEVAKFAPGLRVHILKGAEPYDLTKEKRGRRDDDVPFPDVIISNYHKLSGWADVLAGQVRGVFFDECQELRRSSSAKYSAAKHLAERAEIRMGLSATPIFNFGSEIYSVFRVLNPLALGTYEEFVREWCLSGYDDKEGRARIRDPKAFGLYVRENALMLRRTRKEVGRELPPVVSIPHHIDADEAPLEQVESAAAELARIILTQGGQARGEKLRASEELSWRLRQATGIAKAPHVAAFVRMLVESGERVLLFGWHREVYNLWADLLLTFRPAFYTGEESPAQKAEAARRFLAGETPVLIMSLRSGAGLDGLQEAARTVVFGELDWSPAVHEQCIGRLARDGQDEPVAAYYLVTDNGSDPVLADVLGLKRQQLEGLRDPNADLIQRLDGGGDQNIRKLAEAYLRQRGLAIPTASEPSLDSTGTEG